MFKEVWKEFPRMKGLVYGITLFVIGVINLPVWSFWGDMKLLDIVLTNIFIFITLPMLLIVIFVTAADGE